MSDPTDKHSPDTAAKKRFVRTRRLLIAIIGLLGALYAAKEGDVPADVEKGGAALLASSP